MQPPRIRGLIVLICAVLGWLVLSVPSASALSVHLQPVLGGFREPLDLVHAPDGSDRLFIVEKGGRIRVAHGDSVAERPFLDIRGVVGARGSEQGLLGLAFDPQYAANGFLYVNYTDRNGDSVVARYQVTSDPDLADPGTGSVVLTQAQPYPNHNGGNLIFGPDGYLWIGFGDGGSGGDPHGNGQSGGTWLGKMLRIDVSGGSGYAIPPDNPFAAGGGVLPEIWALGLRNPFRYSFDSATGDLYIGDVGQNVWEEVDFVPAGSAGGMNFGWNVAEGNHCYNARSCDLSPFAPAIAEYDHSRNDCAIIGGYVYRGSAFPTMQGVYFYADECSGRLWSLSRDDAGNWSSNELLQSGINISSFGEDKNGELYVTSLGDGKVYHLTAE